MVAPDRCWISTARLHSAPIDRVKQQWKRSFRLRAVLHPEAEHLDLPFAFREADGGSFALQAFGSVGITGDQDVLRVLWIPCDDRTLAIRRGKRRLECQWRIDEDRD